MFVVFITLYIDKDIRVARSYSADYLKKCLFSGIRVRHASILMYVIAFSILHTLMHTQSSHIVSTCMHLDSHLSYGLTLKTTSCFVLVI